MRIFSSPLALRVLLALRQAEQAGLVSVGRGQVTILDYEGLARKAR